ncbi:siroheme synthase CysG [Amaricoccus solimangrovi]|uniref:Uroporphyrinogen-III C-methyltransferase n=1 Tax=Amaricoccus solimangrovi TaxID=2589815 RepID=A0A501WY18_9RHOB|nr:siroheme synthase CysG [Amaricoccus solimangrovi]TPE53632.1 uroporphyrinogen-III C-methyltransferase [Amaricoccus solimangrovi]
MKTFPMFLKMAGRRVVILGGGEEAARKARLMLKTEAEIVLCAPALEPELAALVARGRATHVTKPTPDLFAGAALAFVATGAPEEDARLAGVCREAGVVTNVVDAPELCDAFTPSIVDRDPLVVAIGTEGAAPVLARQVKTAVETMLEPRLGDLVALAGRLRDEVAARVAPAKRRAFWAWAFQGGPRRAHARGAEDEAARLLKSAIARGGAGETGGFVSLVGAGPGSRDLITLRGVQRLQEADVIFYDRLVDPDLLELARRDAERVYVGKAPGAHSWPQDRINGVITAAARAGKRVVRLKCGDPGVFARGAEEGAACEAAGIAWEIVPGVTAASAAAAELGGFLTERGLYDSLVLTTGVVRPGDPAPDWGGLARPGTTLALYMSVGAAGAIRDALIGAGAPEGSAVEIVSGAGTAEARIWRTSLGGLAETVAAERVENPAIMLVRLPKAAVVAARAAA